MKEHNKNLQNGDLKILFNISIILQNNNINLTNMIFISSF